MAKSIPIIEKKYKDICGKESKLIEKTFKEIDEKYQELRTYHQNLKSFDLDEKEIKQAENKMKAIGDMLFHNWKLIIKIDQNNESLKFDMYLNTINEYKTQILRLMTSIKEVLKDAVDNSYCRNSTSTNESKTLFNTRRETTQLEMERRNDSLSFRPNIFISENLESKNKDSRDYQIKVIDSLIQDIELQKFEREFNLYEYISGKLKKIESIDSDYVEDKKVLKFLCLIVLSLLLIFFIKKFN